MENIKLKSGILYLEDFKVGKGKIIVETFDKTYSFFWGAMGKESTLKDFLPQTDCSYFAEKLLGPVSCYQFDRKKTFANLRKEIKDRFPWYMHTEFQKEMREEIKRFQSNCNSSDSFVASFQNLFTNLPYYLIDDSIERSEIKKVLTFEEPWHMIGEKFTREYENLILFHEQMCTYFYNLKNTFIPPEDEEFNYGQIKKPKTEVSHIIFKYQDGSKEVMELNPELKKDIESMFNKP